MSQLPDSAKNLTTRNLWSVSTKVARRGHGGNHWQAATTLIQPQDGAIENRNVTDISTRLQVAAFGAAALNEPEDARLTGGTRSMMRRLLGLNMPRVSTPVKFPTSLPASFAGVPQVTASKPTKRSVTAGKQAQVA